MEDSSNASANSTSLLETLSRKPEKICLQEVITLAQNPSGLRMSNLPNDLRNALDRFRQNIIDLIEKILKVSNIDHRQKLGILAEPNEIGRHVAALNPLERDGNAIWESLEGITREIAIALSPSDTDATENDDLKDPITLLSDRIRALIICGIFANARHANKMHILKIGEKAPFRPADVFYTWGKIKNDKKISDETEQSIEFCRELGIDLDEDKEKAKEQIRIIKSMAWKFLYSLMQKANETIDNEPDVGTTMIGISDTLQTESLFSWVNTMFDPKKDKKIRFEAQILLKLCLEFFNITSSRAFLNGTQMLPEISKKIQELLPNTAETIQMDKLVFNDDGGIKEIHANSKRSTPLRKIAIDGFEEFRKLALFIAFNTKDAESIMTKLLTKKHAETPNNVRDIVRCTLVIPDVTLTELENNARGARDYFIAIAKAFGQKLKLEYIETNGNPKCTLKPGQFRIENNLTEPESLFRNIKFLGVLKDPKQEGVGTTIEIQLNTSDLYAIATGQNSPFNHDQFKLRYQIDLLRHILAPDLYGNELAILERVHKRISERRENATTECQIYIAGQRQREKKKDTDSILENIDNDDSAGTIMN